MRKNSGSRIPLSLEIAPLVDVVLLLLIFFLLTFSLNPQHMQLELPEASTGGKTGQSLVVFIDEKGGIFTEGKKVNLETLFSFLRRRAQEPF